MADPTATVFWFALAAQVALAWIFTGLFSSFARASRSHGYLTAWTRASFARAMAYSALLVAFLRSLSDGHAPNFGEESPSGRWIYFLYQAGKLLSSWWLLWGVLLLREVRTPPRTQMFAIALALSVAGCSILYASDIESLLVVQAVPQIVFGLIAARILLRTSSPKRTLGNTITGLCFASQSLLWALYAIAFLNKERGVWPIERTFWTVLASHNSYFDLVCDTFLASGLLVLILQQVHRRNLLAEAERSHLEQELLRSEKMRALGTLVSGVAHELNNPLAAILGFSDLLSAQTTEQARERAAHVTREHALRCRRIVRGLSTFSGRESEHLEAIDVAELLQRVGRGFELECTRRSINMAFDLAPGLPRLQGDPFALEQLLANLIANAVQASPDQKQVRISASLRENWLELLVEDEGAGIAAEAWNRLFDPFFTTKPAGQGMGLGLAVAHGIAQQHGGTLRAENRDTGGARFRLRLPLQKNGQKAPANAGPTSNPSEPRRPKQTLSLLVVEDEPALCEILQRFGRLRGWSVTTATTGHAALQLLRSTSQEFHVILCDLHMPSLSGIELHDRLAAEAPELLSKALFFTGDLHSEPARVFAQRSRCPILGKPFDLDELATRIEALACAAPEPQKSAGVTRAEARRSSAT